MADYGRRSSSTTCSDDVGRRSVFDEVWGDEVCRRSVPTKCADDVWDEVWGRSVGRSVADEVWGRRVADDVGLAVLLDKKYIAKAIISIAKTPWIHILWMVNGATMH